MNARLTIVVLTALASASGCTPGAREVSGREVLAKLTSDPLDCMVYRGSDSTYHYFDRVQFKTATRFKVRREEILMPANTKVGAIPIGMKCPLPTPGRQDSQTPQTN